MLISNRFLLLHYVGAVGGGRGLSSSTGIRLVLQFLFKWHRIARLSQDLHCNSLVFPMECKAQGVPPTRTCDDTALSFSTLSSLCLIAIINAVSEDEESSWLIVLKCE